TIDPHAGKASHAGIGAQKSGDHVECGRLPGTVRPDQSGDRSLRHRETRAVNSSNAAEGFPELGHLEKHRTSLPEKELAAIDENTLRSHVHEQYEEKSDEKQPEECA